MTPHAYPRDRIESVVANAKLPPSYRIIPRQYLKTPLGTEASDSRFCTLVGGYTVLYCSPDFAAAFIETIVRDRFTRTRQREVLLKEVTERVWVLIATRSRVKLRLLDLRQDGCVRLGAPTDAVNARNHTAGRALGRAIYAEHKDIDGLLYSSRLTGGADVYAVFDRAIRKLDATEVGALQDHADVPDVLARHSIDLVVRK